MNTGSNSTYTRQDRSRQGRLAQAYKFCIKRILDCAESRYGKPLDGAFREAVMVEAQVFFQTAKHLMGDENPIYEEFFHETVALCQSVQHSKNPDGS